MNRRTLLAWLPFALLLASRAGAQESPSDWVKRILDPAAIGVTVPPGAELNRKITVDTIRTDDPRKRIAVYMAPVEQIDKAAEHFEKTLKVKPKATDVGSPFTRYEFNLTGGGDYPKSAEGLKIVILHSPFVDGRAQITMEIAAK